MCDEYSFNSNDSQYLNMFLPIQTLVITILYVYTKVTLAYKLIFGTSLMSRILSWDEC